MGDKTRKDKQPASEGSEPENAKDGVLGDGTDAVPAAELGPVLAAALVAPEAPEVQEPEAPEVQAESAEPALTEAEAAKVERLASMHGVAHSGDHEATARKIASFTGHHGEKDLKKLVAKLAERAGV